MKGKGKAVPMAVGDNDWQAEDDVRTLVQAEKIKADPKRMKRAMAKKKEMQKNLAAIGN